VIGASLVTLVKELLQDILPSILGRSGNFEIVVFGMLMVILLQFAREGVWPLIARALPRRTPPPVPDAEGLPVRAPSPSGTPLLEVKQARKQFGGLIAVDALSFSLDRGEIVGLIGPNGAGKSTVFNLISGTLPLSSGEVVFADLPIAGLRPFEIARRGIARTFQHVKLIPGMTVRDNVALGAYLRGRTGVARAAARLERCRSASSGSSRSRARSPPTPCCCCSTSPRRACAISRSRSSPH
jgi:branched-chain amino acid transport system permease protein